MTGQEARDDERRCIEDGCAEEPNATWERCSKHQDALESLVSGRPVPTTAMIRRYYARAPIAFREDGSVAREATPESIAFCERQFDRWLEAHNAEMVAAGYRNNPEPEITDEMVERSAHAYWAAGERDVFGEDFDWDWPEVERDRYLWAARTVLEAALSAPVGEGEQ